MPLNNIIFNTATGGLGRLPLGEDYVSAMMVTIASGASGFLTTEFMKEYRSLAEVEAAGITESGTNALTWYHAREFFRIAGPAVLWIVNSAVYATAGIDNFVATSAGKIRQMAWTAPITSANLSSELLAKNGVAVSLDTMGAPCNMIMGVADASLASFSALADARVINAPWVSVVAMGDGSGKGNTLATTLTVPVIPAVGTLLGTMAKASVHESVAWVGKFNISDGTEFVKFRDAKGVNTTHSEAILTGISDKGYLFFRTFIGLSGAYWNDSPTAAPVTSDFSTIENNRTMGKAKRLIRSTLFVDLASPLTVQANGKLAADTVKYFENKVGTQLDGMVNDGELSNYSVLVDPEQNVLSTSILKIQVRLQPRGVARQIQINIGFSLTVSL